MADNAVDLAVSPLDADALLKKAGAYAKAAAIPLKLEIGSDVEIAQQIATWLRATFGGHVVYSEGEFRVWNGKCWEIVEAHELRLMAHRWDGVPVGRGSAVRLGRTRINSVLGELAAILTQRDWFAARRVGINCENGFIDLTGNAPVLVPHDPALRQQHVFGAEWGGPQSIKGSLLERLLVGCFKGAADADDRAAVIGEVAGAAATGYATRLMMPKATVLIGEEAENGKSQVLTVLRGSLPGSAVSTVPPTKFNDERYVVRLAGKLLNTSDELGSADAISGEMFKRLVTGDPVEARDLYSSAVFFRAVAQHVFACNALPAFKGGMDRGVLRRLQVVPFNRVIPVGERVPHIAERILAEEMSLVLSWLIEGAARVMRQRAFTEPPSSQVALQEWAQSVDPVLGWLAERTVRGEGFKLETGEGYKDFHVWALQYGYKNLPTKNTFSTRLRVYAKLKPHHAGMFRGFVGAKLRGLEVILG